MSAPRRSLTPAQREQLRMLDRLRNYESRHRHRRDRARCVACGADCASRDDKRPPTCSHACTEKLRTA